MSRTLRYVDPSGCSLDDKLEKRAKKAEKDNGLSKEDKETIAKARSSKISFTSGGEVKDAAIKVTDPTTGNQTLQTGTAKEMTKAASDAEGKGKDARVAGASTEIKGDAEGIAVSAQITLYKGSKDMAQDPMPGEKQAVSAQSLDHYLNKAFVEEFAHFNLDTGKIIKSEKAAGHE